MLNSNIMLIIINIILMYIMEKYLLMEFYKYRMCTIRMQQLLNLINLYQYNIRPKSINNNAMLIFQWNMLVNWKC